MLYRYKIRIVLLLAIASGMLMPVYGQQITDQGSKQLLDSLDHRIGYLRKQIERLKQVKDVSYLNTQRELDHTLFLKTYQEYIAEEDLEMAKLLVEKHIEKSEFRRDQSSVKYYDHYQDDIYARIKEQRAHYQKLFLKEKIFKKEFEAYTGPGTIAAYQKTQRFVRLALKYAQENNLTETITYLTVYESFIKALIFDVESSYDLATLTNNEKDFEKVFLPLVSSDSLEGIKEAEKLLDHCKNYGRLTGSSLDGEYFKKQEMMLTSALSDLLEKEGREKELARYTNQSVVAKYDTLNPCGVFKWHDQIVVIDEFLPTSGMENVKKGEAIIHADRMLATYLQKNKLCQTIKDLKLGYAFIIPYKSNAKNSSFYYNQISMKWQYIVCYTVVVNPEFTAQVSKFMPPLFFEDEMNVADK
jgi:hypothetical protein